MPQIKAGTQARDGAQMLGGSFPTHLPLARGPALPRPPREARPRVSMASLPPTDHPFLFILPGGREHCCEKGSMGFLTHKAPKRQYFDDLSINDQKHVDFISFRIHLGMKMKGKRAWQSMTRASSNP